MPEAKQLGTKIAIMRSTSDIPELSERFWQNAIRNPFYRPVKQQLTLRLDADVIAWLRRQGKGYQTRANALLRDAMLEESEPENKEGGRLAPPYLCLKLALNPDPCKSKGPAPG
jgi:uncharacterized protein (DUF4415 family)